MAHAGKYGEVGIEHIPDDEPVFIIRAQDALAVPMLKMYEVLAELAGTTYGFQDHIDQIRADVEYWQEHHETKVPD